MNLLAKDLWGEFDIENISQKTPIYLLKEQASLLDKKTNNIIRGEVVSTPLLMSENSKLKSDRETQRIRKSYYNESKVKDRIVTVFNIVVPALKNYRFELLRTESIVAETFPILLKSFWQKRYNEIDNLNEFEAELSNILSEVKTKELLVNLIMRGQNQTIN